MTKRLLLFSAMVFLGAVGVATRFRPLSARAESTVIALQPSRSFQIQGADGLRLNDIETHNGDLYLLLSDGSGLNEILHITGAGKTLKTIPLPPPPPSAKQKQYSHLRISPSGTMAVSFSHFGAAPLTTISLYDTNGSLKASFDVTLFNEIAFIGDDLVGVGPSGITQLTSQSRFVPNASSLPLDFVDRVAMVSTASLPQQRLAIVEPLSGRLQIVTLDSLSVAPMILQAPEIQGVERPEQPDPAVFSAVVHTIAASPSGNIYIGVTGAKRQEGAPVLQFDSSGVLKNRIKCVLPTFGQDPSIHESYMYPAKLLATNDSLYWISMSEKKVAIYIIGNLN